MANRGQWVLRVPKATREKLAIPVAAAEAQGLKANRVLKGHKAFPAMMARRGRRVILGNKAHKEYPVRRVTRGFRVLPVRMARREMRARKDCREPMARRG